MMAIGTNERVLDPLRIIKDAIESALAGVWTALPCIVETYDKKTVTITAQPTIQAQVSQVDGSIMLVDLPVLQDVPVMFQRGGGVTMTFPIKPGDECLVVFSSRCIDLWWQNGGIQLPFENRKHDLSDGFAFFAPQSQPNKISNISDDSVQLRSDDGQTFISLNPEQSKVTITASNTLVDSECVFTKKVTFKGQVVMESGLDITGPLVNNEKSVGSSHVHSGGTLSGKTGEPE